MEDVHMIASLHTSLITAGVGRASGCLMMGHGARVWHLLLMIICTVQSVFSGDFSGLQHL